MWKKVLLGLMLLIVVIVSGTAVWMSIPFSYQQQETDNALLSSTTVTVSQDDFIVFAPAKITPQSGIVFYPGGKTSAVTFAPFMRQFAEAGYLAVIAPMPLKTAFLGINKADDVLATYPEIKQWVIAGHSLGGVGAAEYIKGADLTKVKGLLLLASYPASDISALDVAVMSISGSKDLQSTPEKIALNKPKLPSNTQYVVIENANHWQFGSFAPENTIQQNLLNPTEQEDQVFSHSSRFLQGLGL